MKKKSLKFRKGDQIKIPAPFDVRCFCGQRVTLSGGDEHMPPCVIHEVPTCLDFDKRGPTEFVRWLNERGAS